MRFQVYVENNKKIVNFDERQLQRHDMYLRNATIFWRMKNIKKGYNDDILDTSDTKVDTISEGYYTLDDLQTKLKTNNITLDKNFYDNSVSLTATTKDIKLGKLGVLLGFAKDHILRQNKKSDGTKPVEVNHGLRFVKLSADIVDKSYVNFEGQRSDVFATLPVETNQRLFGTRTHFPDLNLKVAIVRNFSSAEFKISSNIDWELFEMDALLDLDIV